MSQRSYNDGEYCQDRMFDEGLVLCLCSWCLRTGGCNLETGLCIDCTLRTNINSLVTDRTLPELASLVAGYVHDSNYIRCIDCLEMNDCDPETGMCMGCMCRPELTSEDIAEMEREKAYFGSAEFERYCAQGYVPEFGDYGV